MKYALTAVVFVAATAGTWAAEPFFETVNVWPKYENNRPNYRIPAIVTAPNGELLIFAEKRNDGIGDVGNHDLVLKRSADKGKTWGPEALILDDGDNTSTDITIAVDRIKGKIFLLFLQNKKKYAYMLSADSGKSWSGPISIHEQVTKPEWDKLGSAWMNPKDYAADAESGSKGKRWAAGWIQRYGVGPGAGAIQLKYGPKKGRILVPARHKEEIGDRRTDTYSHVFYSDDHGQTWKLGGTVGRHGNECQLVELVDGRVLINMRDENHEDGPDNYRQLMAISKDGGETWGAVWRNEALVSPRVHSAIERFTTAAEHGKNRLLFSNPATPLRQEQHPYGRYNLSMRVSYDEGLTWTTGKTIYPHPSSYSDIAILDDMSIAVVYERGPRNSTHYWDEIQFARFNLEWLTDGKDTVPRGGTRGGK